MERIATLAELGQKALDLQENSIVMSNLITYARIADMNHKASSKAWDKALEHSKKMFSDCEEIQRYISGVLVEEYHTFSFRDKLYANNIIDFFVDLTESLTFVERQ